MTVVAPETQARAALKQILSTEFAPESYTVLDDKLDASLGSTGARIGTSPISTRPSSRNEAIMGMSILVQFYGKWKKAINPEQRVDPQIIEAFAERFRRAVALYNKGGHATDQVWFFTVSDVNFLDDPTGNKTRFEATVVATGTNSALIVG